MKILDLDSLPREQVPDADLLIIGGGPAGIAIAREFAGTSVRVVLIESGGRRDDGKVNDLNQVESTGEPRSDAQRDKRIQFHGSQSESWTPETQPFGVRVRGLGGATQAWAGKSATFDEIDFDERPWVKHSGWPVSRAELKPYFDRAGQVLNLGPNVYGADFWDARGEAEPKPRFDSAKLRPFFWQFARSKIDHMDVMRIGDEFLLDKADNITVILHATATRLKSSMGRVSSVDVVNSLGYRFRFDAQRVVLATGAIEVPRLLLHSGLGNAHDQVGRYLMDHAGLRIARFDKADTAKVYKRFGFFALNHEGQVHLYMHGLALSPEIQRGEGLNNCALYMLEDRAPDDPLGSLKRLLKFRSRAPFSDLWATVKSPGLIFKAVGVKTLQSQRVPKFIKDLMVNTVMVFNPNFVAREFQSGGLPHKLLGLNIDAISEQRPDPESRVTLSENTDRNGVPLPLVHWTINPDAATSMARLARLMEAEFVASGLPRPTLEDWILRDAPEEAVIIDMAHTVGTARMSSSPRSGVVDEDCRVFGTDNLYVASGAVFPTSGHANPTLMILTLAIRLADHLKGTLGLSRQAEED